MSGDEIRKVIDSNGIVHVMRVAHADAFGKWQFQTFCSGIDYKVGRDAQGMLVTCLGCLTFTR